MTFKDIKIMWISCSITIFTLILTAQSMTIGPGENITEENCNGRLDYFLCNCLSTNATIDIQLLPGYYNFTNQQFCLLHNKTKISITGSSSNDTTIECIESFSLVFVSVQNVTISNIKMINCGDVVNDVINKTFREALSAGYFGTGFRFAMLFVDAINVFFTEFTMLHTLGYGIVAVNMMGEVSLSKLYIGNTTFENDLKCKNYDYGSNAADFSCSGSGMFFLYKNTVNLEVTNTALTFDKSFFINNKNFLPFTQFHILSETLQTAFNQASLPVQGAACITILYQQNSYDVNTTITNTFFHNNNGTLGATVGVASFSTIRSKTNFINCSFDDNGRVSNMSSFYAYSVYGGLSFQYLTVRNIPGLSISNSSQVIEAEMFTVTRCNFTRNGGDAGAAIYIQKVSVDSVLVFVRIEECHFSENEGSAGSAVYSISRDFRSSSLSNYLTITLVNVHAKNNIVSPGSTIQYVSSDLITGVFSAYMSSMIFNCSKHCTFINNQPSLYFGYSASLSISGKATFLNNSGIYGGAIDLIDTVLYIYQGSELYFGNNHANRVGGAIDVLYTFTNLQTPVHCPFQFIGPSGTDPIFSFDKISQLNVNITFENNTSGVSRSLESIYANVYYLCYWYPETITQFNFKLDSPPTNGARESVYGKVFKFIPPDTAHQHVYTSAYLPCICDENNSYDPQYCITADINNELQLKTTVVIGRSFTLNLITLDAVGLAGFTRSIYGEVFSVDFTDESFQLPEYQNRQPFNILNKQCTSVEFTIYAKQSEFPKYGILRLAVLLGSDHFFYFNVSECPVGFSLQEKNGQFACVCGDFFMNLKVSEDFQCDSVSGMIVREDERSWLSVVKDNVEYIPLCSPVYCNDVVNTYTLADHDILCDNNHAGRACGKCANDFGRVFGSNSCRKCSNFWLATILLYAILGIILVMILYLLKLTVTMGTVNGLIFFCNVMSIDERLFFNTEDSRFLFLRVFISLINLDLGFEICFYNEMSQVAKTALQFVFPVYLWLLLAIIILSGKYHFRGQQISSYSTVPVLATLMFISYAKILRTIISIFSYVPIYYTTKESDFSQLQKLIAWQPDPNVAYSQGSHIVLFLIAMVFMLLLIIPFALAMTFPTVVLRSKRMSRLFPLLDCFYAPYKDKYRYWFGVRLLVLIYLSIMESIIFSYQEALLLSTITVLFVFSMVQAYIKPFKNTLINLLDLTFMGLFVLLSMITLYLYPSTSGYDEVNRVVNIGYIAFLLFCLIITYHVHNALKHFAWYRRAIKTMMEKSSIKKVQNWGINHNLSLSSTSGSSTYYKEDSRSNYNYLQESFLEHM